MSSQPTKNPRTLLRARPSLTCFAHNFHWQIHLISYDHKVIAKQFLWTGMVWAIIGAFLSVLIRWCSG
jgi:hypothetical protein